MRPLRTVGAILALALALVAGGCGGGDDEDRQSSASDDRTSQSAEGVDALGGSPPEEPAQEAEPPSGEEPSSGDVVAARDGEFNGKAVRLEITELRRSGTTTALTFELSIDEPRAGETDDTAQVGAVFDDGFSEADGGKGQDPFTTDGISLIDTANSKRYLVARDSEGVCVCDGELSSTFVESAAPLLLSATFGAPPADIEAVDVVIPKFGTFKDVPLS